MTTTATAPAAIQEIVTFSLDDEEYGISITRVQEIIRHTPSRPVPGRPRSWRASSPCAAGSSR